MEPIMGIGGSKDAVMASRVNFEAVPSASSDGLLISTIDCTRDAHLDCAIIGTTDRSQETEKIQRAKEVYPNMPIVIYGANSTDTTPFFRWKELTQMGLTNVSVYTGGLFEWLLLGETYGTEAFGVTTPQDDLLKFKGSCNG